MANFPLVTWQVSLPTFDVTLGAGSPVPVTPTDAYGFGLINKNDTLASLDSVAGAFAEAIDTAFAGISAEATYQFTNGTVPATTPLLWTMATSAADAITIEFASLEDAAVYGFGETTITIPSGTQSTQTVFNPAGVWVPCGVAGDVRRTTTQRAAASSSEMSGLSTDVVNWGQVANLEFLSSIFPAANLTRWYAQIEPYYTAAQRQKFDPNNTLEGLLEAAATGVTFRLYRQAADTAGTTPYTYNEARMPIIADKSSAGDYAQADDEPRLWSTSGMFFRGNT